MKHQMLLDDEQLILVRDDFCRQASTSLRAVSQLCCHDETQHSGLSLQMDSGLGGEPSSLLMIPSMVDIIPSGCAQAC